VKASGEESPKGVIPDTWPDQVRRAAKDWAKIDEAHTIQDDLAAVNPNRSKSLRYQVNCGNCAGAYEMRRRGFDVEAMPISGMYGEEDWKGMFEGFEPLKPDSADKSGVVEELTREILSWGEGARGTVLGSWDNKRGGHIFSFEVYEKKLYLLIHKKIKTALLSILAI
jgi:hypothetical protein